jgi:hypothetical protein
MPRRRSKKTISEEVPEEDTSEVKVKKLVTDNETTAGNALYILMPPMLAGAALGAMGGKLWGDYEGDGDAGMWIGVAVGVVAGILWGFTFARSEYALMGAWLLCLIGIGLAFFTHYYIDSESIPGFFMLLAFVATPLMYTSGYEDGMWQEKHYAR